MRPRPRDFSLYESLAIAFYEALFEVYILPVFTAPEIK